jgi:hypothetical protein
MFLLDCPVQAATCERIFKEYSRFHTKRRANLHNSTTFRMTQVKGAIKEKYRQDNKGNADPKNKFVNPAEHERIDVPLSPAAKEEDNMNTDSGEGNDDEDNEWDEEQECGDLIESWVKGIDAGGVDNNEEDDDDSDNENDGSDEHDEEVEEFDFMCFETAKDPPEKWPVIRDDNEDNFRNWPQENPDYFKRKKKENGCYVRGDKYSLSLLCEVFTSKVPAERRCELPPMSTAYGANMKDS